MPTTLGIIGCGAIFEKFYTPAITSLDPERVQLTHLVDPNTQRLQTFSSYFPSIRTYASLDGIIDNPPHGLIVATPSGMHEDHARSAIQAGAHVFIEKPLAHTLDSAERIVTEAEASDAIVGVAMFRRFWPALKWIKDAIEGEALGRLLSLDHQEGGPFDWPAASTSFFEPKKAGGGVLLDIGVHVIDTLVWWLGTPAIESYWDDAEDGLEANCRLSLKFRNDTRATVFLSRDWKTRNQMTLLFEKATVIWEAGTVNQIQILPKGSTYWLRANLETRPKSASIPADTYQQSFTRQLVSFIEAIEGSREVEVTPRDALVTLGIIDACYKTRRNNGMNET